ncbi:MAG: hypothetical protein IKA57_02080 [Clostridia bacterium]|nr:hypothetical protein [Clostridia bacterium]
MSFHSKYNARKKKIESGLPDGPLEDTGITTNRKGTTVRFKPDKEVFSELDFNLETVEERLRQLAFLNRGVEIILIDERITMAEAKRARMLYEDEETITEEGETPVEESLEEGLLMVNNLCLANWTNWHWKANRIVSPLNTRAVFPIT